MSSLVRRIQIRAFKRMNKKPNDHSDFRRLEHLRDTSGNILEGQFLFPQWPMLPSQFNVEGK